MKLHIENNLLAVLLVFAITLSLTSNIIMTMFMAQKPVATTGLISQPTQSGEANVTLPAEVAIELFQNAIDFGDLSVGESNATSDLNPSGPAPFALRNIGSVDVNVSMSMLSTDYLWETQTGTSEYFKFNATSNGSTQALWYGGSDDPDGLTQVPAAPGWPSTDPANVVYNLSQENGYNVLNVNINITAPSGEPAGAKGATLRFQADIG